MDNHPSAIEQLSNDVSYLRGRFDTIIPQLQKSNDSLDLMLTVHTKQINELEAEQNIMKGKVIVVGSIAGTLLGSVFFWLGKHF